MLIEDNQVTDISVANSGSLDSYLTINVQTDITSGQLVSILTTESLSELRIDYVDQFENPYQMVETYSESIVGSEGASFRGDGISVSSSGELFVSSGAQDGGRVVNVSTSRTVSDFATNLNSANGSDFDSNGNLFVASYQSDAVFKFTPDGTRTTFASNLNGPAGLWVDNNDNVYVGLFGRNFSGDAATVLRFTPDGVQSVYATGQGLNDVIGVVGDDNGEIYAGNFNSAELYRITNGNVALYSNLKDTLSNARINMIDYADGFIYVPVFSGRILRVDDSNSETSIFAGSADESTTNGPINEATFSSPAAIDFSSDNQEMFVIDSDTGNVRRVYIGD